ncbi:hypothetical protein [uncultured Clostridium sp.]|uniref:hypothetical protein n=1 Tax=uncultured Clostridium sp. TaxID=59620 RepID=UPI0025DB197A|nr:hypothetical protein [uncultured Clostridium sp.]
MKTDVIFLKEDSFIFDKNEYGFNDFLEDNMLSKKLKIIILGEVIYIERVLLKFRFLKINKLISDKIQEIFPNSSEILHDYKINLKEKIIYMYSIKGKKKVENLCYKSNYLEVIPFQFLIGNILNKLIRKKYTKFMVLIKFNDEYYFMEYAKNNLIDNAVSSDINNIYEYLNEKNLQGKIIIDEKCFYDEYYFKNMEIIKMNILEKINEKI